MNNYEIRQAIKESGHYHWEVAEALGISEGLLSRRLRRELPQEEKVNILKAIEGLKVKGV